jgi:hypothetical protein
VKTDRFSTVRAAALLLTGLLVVAGNPAAGQITFKYHLGKPGHRKDSDKALSEALALQLAEVQKTFDANRRTLHTVRLRNGKPAYARQEVANLIDHTQGDLDRAIVNVQPAGLEPLRAWSADALHRIQQQLAATPGQTAALLPGAATPRAVAVIASLGRLPLELAGVGAAPQAEAVPTATADSLLDQVGNVISRIFSLASHDDLYVKLWAGSTAPHTTFSFWPEGQIKGSALAISTIQTDNTRDHVLRGLYSYKAVHADGAVAEFIQYPNPAGASATQTLIERLDLVNGSTFFCCRPKEDYCHHVASEKECHS